jgi:DNA-binding GntR family transcriptional regulator
MARESLNPVDRGTLDDRVYQEIRRALMIGSFAPGTTITLQGLAHEVRTSIMPVRDALHRLVAEHALDLLPNRSIAVPMLTLERLGEIRDLRLALESMAATLAADRISDRELADMAAVYETMRGQRGLTADEYIVRNQDFHFAIYRAVGRPVLFAMIETLWLQIGPSLSETLRQSGRRFDLQHHEAVLVALRARNAKAAGRGVAAIILAVSDLVMSALQLEEARST